ncbi:RNA-binding domain-containing protein [Reichenbachiella ulvae]|uniref:DNA binding domain-containing protein n=1 Tax=Reichenbachiella ulvae TaxID=2980104 RepID=A0ABT3CQF6_9BACT|nr:RNA-binding domain-containing protein [Reichenbachiella ulvae]MCV9385778.1 putative DNA binding domain-containing protein [Reichenbachiella ulvae]
MKPRFKKLFLNLSVLIVIVALALLGYVTVTIQKARTELSKQAIKELSDRSMEHFEAFYNPIDRMAAILSDWGREEVLLIDDPQRLTAQLMPLLKELQLISGLSIADTLGNSYYLTQLEGNWLYRYYQKETGLYHWVTIDSTMTVLADREEELDYDPKTRAWYQLGMSEVEIRRPLWTKAYSFSDSQDWGVSGVVNWQDSTKGTIVAAVDIPLKNLFTRISTFGKGSGSQSFLFNDEEKVFDPNHSPQFFVSTTELDEYFDKVLNVWSDSAGFQSNSFEWSGDKYWVGLQPLHITQRSIWLATFTREGNFFTVLGNNFASVGVVSVMIVLLGILVAFWLVRRAKPQIEAPEIEMSNFESSVKSWIAQGEGSQVEFKSTVRMNLHSNNPGKEIELAWLKGVVAFLNTDGGLLFLGVDDEGEFLGLNADRFPNEDKCLLHVKNLIKEHIGPSYFQFIDFGVRSVEGMNLVYIQVKPSTIAAYLKPKTGEEIFYIRSGPASEKLPMSKVVDYLKRRRVFE